LRVIETSTSEDLSDFSRFLWQQRVRHRIYEESGTLIVDVTEPEDAVEVRHHYNQWRAGRLAIEPEPMLAPRPIAIGKWLNNNPVSAAIVILLPDNLGLAQPNKLGTLAYVLDPGRVARRDDLMASVALVYASATALWFLALSV